MARRRTDRVSFREKHGALYARFQIPEKEDGEIGWRSIERSTRTLDPAKARSIVDAWKKEAIDTLSRPADKKGGMLFANAITRYVKQGGKNKRYLLRILDEIGRMPVGTINQDAIDALAEKLYPSRTAATLNRHIYTPICAVLNAVASDTFTPPRIKRPRGHLAPSNFRRPPKDWFQRVLPECEPNLAALLLFCRLHGRRTSEACNLRPNDVDAETWRVTVRDSKQSQEIVFKLASPVIEQLNIYPWRLKKYVFGFSSSSRLYPALRAACERAGAPYHVPKDVGRHSFATALLDSGKTLKEVQEAGRWASITMPALVYGHLEHSRVDDEAREIGEKWAEKTLRSGDVIAPDFRANSGRAKSEGGK